MSEQSGGPGWWQASDGLWYSPESHPDDDYKAQFAPAASATSATSATSAPVTEQGGYPARVIVSDDNEIARWRVFLQYFMAIPHLFIVNVLWTVAQVVAVVSWFVVLFTAKMPEGIHNFQSMILRYNNRAMGFSLLLTEEYPPFEFDTTAEDGTSYPIRSEFDYQPGPRNRWTTFFRGIMVIPHWFVLIFIFIGAVVVYTIAWFAVLFMGRMPQGMRDYLIGTGRWTTRVTAYFGLLTDDYPPFSLD